MGRLARDCFAANYHHIMTQGIGKSCIFKEEVNKIKMLNIMREEVQKGGVKLLAYCIMDNHLHVLMNSSNISDMSNFMKIINIRYARYYNKKYNRVGYVFRDRYKSQPIVNEHYLLRCMRYIHNNPVKAGISKEITDYQWSSFGEILSDDSDILDMTSVFELFSLEPKKALYSFCEFHNKKYEDDSFMFLEDEPVIDENEKKSFLYLRDTNMADLQDNSDLMIDYVTYLKDELKMSQRQISEWVGLGRTSIVKMIKPVSPSPRAEVSPSPGTENSPSPGSPGCLDIGGEDVYNITM